MRGLTGVLLAMVLLMGCDAAQRGEIGLGTSGGDVRLKMGEPETIWREDGRELWDYPRGPEGPTTLRLTIVDGVVKEQRNILTKENLATIQKGMNKESVRRIAGRPGKISRTASSRGDTWEWKYLEQNNVKTWVFHVDYDEQGLVLGTGSVDPELYRGAP
jgi:SmpA / OmlA family